MKRSLRVKIGAGEFISLEIDDLLHDIFLTLSVDEFGHIAAANGYVKLEPGQVVVDAAEVGDALAALCDTCAGECSMCGVKDVLSAIKEARDE